MPEPARSEQPLRIAYLLKMFPRLSETFVLHELLELERREVEISVFSLFFPNDGRFHGRLGELRLTTRYVPRDKPEVYWDQLKTLPAEHVPSFERWDEAAAWLRRFGIQKDLDLLLRCAVIAAQLRQAGVQHVHAHFATIATRAAAVVNILSGIPFSFTSHAKDIFRQTVDWELYADLLERAAFNVTVSDYNRRHLLARLPDVDPRSIVRLYNGVDLDFFTPAPTRPEQLRLLSVGRLVPKKGFDHLLRGLACLRSMGRPFTATIVGEGEQGPALRALCSSLGLDDVVTFAGAQAHEQVREACREASMVVLACVPDQDGNQDALPTVLLEALALDLPVVSTRLSGIPEIVGEGPGRVVPPGDAEALARAVAEVDDEMRRDGGCRGQARARAEQLFDLRRNVGTLHEMFRRSAAGAGG